MKETLRDKNNKLLVKLMIAKSLLRDMFVIAKAEDWDKATTGRQIVFREVKEFLNEED